jgi:hypothetical protein
MSSQLVERPLTHAERHEIAEYERIIAFSEQILSGKHPKYKLVPMDLSSSDPPANAPVGLKGNYNDTRAKRLKTSLAPANPPPNRAPPSLKDAARILQPSQSSGILPISHAATIPPSVGSGKGDTARLDYTRDYYQELGVERSADRNQLVTALLKNTTPFRREAYNILTDSYLRHIYDDARALPMNWAEDSSQVDKRGKSEEAKDRVVIDMKRDYYKDLGINNAAVGADSIFCAFRAKGMF